MCIERKDGSKQCECGHGHCCHSAEKLITVVKAEEEDGTPVIGEDKQREFKRTTCECGQWMGDQEVK